MAAEETPYEVIRQYSGFELRRYSPYLVAETRVTGKFEEVGNQAFRVLFGYISGDNRRNERIAMTAPVTQEPDGEKIQMTTPVIQAPAADGGANTYTLAFVMPSKYTMDTLPQPVDSRITLRPVPARWMAARRFSGTWSEDNYRRNEKALLEDVTAAGLQIAGEPLYARYNSPFTLWFLRRNEAMVEVVAGDDAGQP
jgi:hypothetical protein